jgi:hypothetical protein
MAKLDNFNWLVKARASNQEALLRLYRLAKDNPEKLQSDEMGRSLFTLLIGAGFSLWRAAFLSDARREWTRIVEDATQLLERLVRDNAVAYPQDRETREWMAGYYLNNAQWRLLIAWKQLKCQGHRGSMPVALRRVKKYEDRGAEQELPIELWNTSHAAFRELLNVLEKRLHRG